MRLFTLSNHAANLAEQTRTTRELLNGVAHAGYLAACLRRQRRLDSLGESVKTSVRRLRLHCAAIAAARWLRLHISPAPRKPDPLPTSRQELIWLSGAKGEEIAHQHFRESLSDDWTAVAGYKNGKGEIDLILVGRQGVICLETKYLNSVVHCLGDRWTRDMTDRFGNLVQAGVAIEDKAGRSPSEQLLEPCAVLSRFLGQQALPFEVRMWTGVLLTHGNSRIGRVQRPTVDFVGRLDEFTVNALTRMTEKMPPALNVPVVVELIHTHHQLVAQRQAAGRGATSWAGV